MVPRMHRSDHDTNFKAEPVRLKDGQKLKKSHGPRFSKPKPSQKSHTQSKAIVAYEDPKPDQDPSLETYKNPRNPPEDRFPYYPSIHRPPMRVTMDQHYRYGNRAMWRQAAEEDEASCESPNSPLMQLNHTLGSFKRRARSPKGSNYDDERHQKHRRLSLEASDIHYDSNYSNEDVPRTHLSKSKKTSTSIV